MKAIYFKLSLRLFLITLREFEFEKLSGERSYEGNLLSVLWGPQKAENIEIPSKAGKKDLSWLSFRETEKKSWYFHTVGHRNACHTTPMKETKK